MTVQELIDRLQRMRPDAEVLIAYDYGDHWHTKVCDEITDVDEVAVRHGPYDKMTTEDADGGKRTAVVLREF